MTETLIVMVTAFAGFLFTDPFFGGALTKASIAKLPFLAMSFGAVTFHLVGRALTDPARLRKAAGEVLAAWWPLMLLSLLITAGSVYARFGDSVKENFLGMGLGMMFLPMMALVVRSSRLSPGFMKALGAVYVLMVLGMLVVLLSGTHVFHEEIFVAVPLGAYFLSARPLRFWQFLLGMALVVACVYSVKNTTFLLVLATLAACTAVWAMRIRFTRDRLALVTGLYFGIPLLLGSLFGLWMTWRHFKPDLPTGNVEYRTEMYGIAWRRFLDSPIWGTGFTDSSVHYFDLYRVALAVQNLPTHSDILDLLSHGGLIAMALWLATVWTILRISWAATRTVALAEPGKDMRAWRCLFVLALIEGGAVITYAVNPPLISPVHAFWVWGTAGLMWALHRHLTDSVPVPAAVPRQARRTAWA